MVRASVDVKWLVTRISVDLVFAIGQVECDVKKVDNLLVCIDGNLQPVIFKKFA